MNMSFVLFVVCHQIITYFPKVAFRGPYSRQDQNGFIDLPLKQRSLATCGEEHRLRVSVKEAVGRANRLKDSRRSCRKRSGRPVREG